MGNIPHDHLRNVFKDRSFHGLMTKFSVFGFQSGRWSSPLFLSKTVYCLPAPCDSHAIGGYSDALLLIFSSLSRRRVLILLGRAKVTIA